MERRAVAETRPWGSPRPAYAGAALIDPGVRSSASMFARIRSLWLAGGGALALTIVLSGVVAAATVLTALTVAPAPTTTVADTTATFEDTNGNGIDDDCETVVVADPVAEASAQAAVDANGDGTVSVTEAAHSDRTGGTNCNHGGYVSSVARGQCATPDTTTTSDESTAGAEDATDTTDAEDATETADAEDATETADAEDATQTADAADCTTDPTADPTAEQPTTCDAAPTTATTTADTGTADPATEDTAPNAHGKAVSEVAQSDAVGGKNCNHGGAVSEAAKKDHAADKEARDAAKAARAAERAAAKAARDAARHGKHHGKPG
jgi:hypothetical protein